MLKLRKPDQRDRFERPYGAPIAFDARPRAKPRKGSTLLRAVRPNVGIEVDYRRRLLALVDAMADSVEHWLRRVYAANEPEMAMDAALVTTKRTKTPGGWRHVVYLDGKPLLGSNGKPRPFTSQAAALKAGYAVPYLPAPRPRRPPLPAADLQEAVDALAVRWQRQFDEAAPDLARYFTTAVSRRSDAALKAALDKGGFTVTFRQTPATRDILKATVEQNVALIKSIPQEYLTGVQGDVMRSVQTGRDLGQLSRDLQNKYGVTRRRAALIARSQNNMATSAMQRARQTELGITEAIWTHSGGGKVPRPTHVRNDGERYDVAKGWYDPAVKKRIWPGELINCRCVSRSVVPGF